MKSATLTFLVIFTLGSFAQAVQPLTGRWVCEVQNMGTPEHPDRMEISIAEPLVTLVGLRKQANGQMIEKRYPLATDKTLLSNGTPREQCQVTREDSANVVQFSMRCQRGGAGLQLDASNNVGNYGESIPPRIKLHYLLENCRQIAP
jgi:hypothetical protein